jgi:hypothetical protein
VLPEVHCVALPLELPLALPEGAAADPLTEGLGEALPGGDREPERLLLPEKLADSEPEAVTAPAAMVPLLLADRGAEREGVTL